MENQFYVLTVSECGKVKFIKIEKNKKKTTVRSFTCVCVVADIKKMNHFPLGQRRWTWKT